MKAAVALFIAFTAIAAGAELRAQTVTVTGGQIRGAMLEKGGAVFKGIPYAAPPVDELRWREPMPVKPWTGVWDATAFGAICPQNRGLSITQAAKEDCLYLNIWAPEWPSTSRKPVMVWIHGGGNIQGGSSQLVSNGESLSRHGVVLVSINYRLGSFGFFSHPALTRGSSNHASGNQGILDQIAALKWVRDNVARFGGDPDNVTIFGESAGSLDVSVLMTSPLSKGLFRRAIGESGAVILLGEPMPLPQAEKRGEALASRWNVPAGASVENLRAVSAADILIADPDYIVDPPANLGITIDGYVFPKKPAEVFATGQQHRVALLLGSNSRDMVKRAPSDLKRTIEETYGPIAGRAQALYVGGSDLLYGSPADQWTTDTTFRCPAVAQLAWHAAAGNPSFHFEFAHAPVGREAFGATHIAELSYVFGTYGRGIVGLTNFRVTRALATSVDTQVSETMQRYWTNFAKTGDPNGGQLPAWPKFDASSRAYIQFTDEGPVAKEGLRRPYCDLFIENVKGQMGR